MRIGSGLPTPMLAVRASGMLPLSLPPTSLHQSGRDSTTDHNIREDDRRDRGQAMWNASRGCFCAACAFLHRGGADSGTAQFGCKFQNGSCRAAAWATVRWRGSGSPVR